MNKKTSSKSDQVEYDDEIELPEVLPILPASDIVPFPSVVLSLYVTSEAGIRAVESVVDDHKFVFVLAQKDSEVDEPAVSDLYTTGVICSVMRMLKLPDNRCKVLLQGMFRGRVEEFKKKKKFLSASVEPILTPDYVEVTAEQESLMHRIEENVRVLVEYEHLPEEILVVTEDIDEPGMFADVVSAHYQLEVEKAQTFLEELDPVERLKLTDNLVTEDLNQFIVSENVKALAQDELSKDQRDYFLREQLKLIRRELGETDAAPDDLAELRSALKKAKLPKHAKEEADKQLIRLERMHVESSEHSLLRTYLEWLADLPWSKKSRERLDLKKARKGLDEDHFGLDKVKDRILEYLSVRKLNKESAGPILCFVGPPGVGKTSLGKTIAAALGRKFHRISIGGVRDEAEIRGHRRTYVGALPGRIIQGLKQAGTNNPVIVLDELDKVGADFRGDPASALLEVLDPQQNDTFTDHYVNIPFDLSNTMFIATANTVDTIPEALMDRLEIIRISGYTTEEKIEIAKRYLVPRQLKKCGVDKYKLKINDQALRFLIERYTREAGVRNLEREIGALCRKVARGIAEGKKPLQSIKEQDVQKMLGPTHYDPDPDEALDMVGLVRGLAWTAHGGEMMPIEASVAKGNGALTLTGRLGDVMQESARAAVFYARANAEALGLDPDFYQKLDIHVHVPGGAIPKDGPSAGISIATAIVSALSGRKISHELAMTGEITLRGNVLQIGGLKEKALAALRYEIKKVIIPYENLKDLEDVPKEQRDQIKFIPVKHIGEVLEYSLKDSSRSRSRGKSKSKKQGRVSPVV